MNHKTIGRLIVLVAVGTSLNLFAQGTAFFYQGRLNDSGGPATGNYDLRFALFDAATNGNAISVPQTNFAVAVAGGIFATNLDFGKVFTGTNYWLSIGVRTNSDTNAFTLLWPRQPILPVPYAIFATTASNLSGTLSATQLVGTLSSSQVSGTYGGTVNFTNAGNNFAGTFNGTFAGNGSSLTSLNGSQITSGTVADARLSGNVALLNTNQTFTGTNTFNGVNSFTNRNNAFTGSFFGNGHIGWIPVYGMATQAVANAGYLLLNTNLTTVTLPPTNSLFVGDIVRIAGPGQGGWRLAQTSGQSVSGIFLNPSNSSWLPASASSLQWSAIASSADGAKMVASAVASGGIYVSTDFGKTWASSSSSSPNCLASSADGVKLFGGLSGGGIIASTNSGSSWFSTSAPSTNWSAIACSANGSNVVAVVNLGRIYTSADSGITWTRQVNSTFATWYAVACSADGKKIAAAYYGDKIYTSTDSGVNWTRQLNSDTTNWTAITSSSDGTKLAAAAFGGRIYTSADSGATWTKQGNSPTENWYGLASSYDGGRIAAVANLTGGIYVSGNYGVNWTKQSLDDRSWFSIACSQDMTTMAAVAYDGVGGGKIFHWSPVIQGTSTSTGVNGSVTGSPGSSVELQYLGDGEFMPISSIGVFWAN